MTLADVIQIFMGCFAGYGFFTMLSKVVPIVWNKSNKGVILNCDLLTKEIVSVNCSHDLKFSTDLRPLVSISRVQGDKGKNIIKIDVCHPILQVITRPETVNKMYRPGVELTTIPYDVKWNNKKLDFELGSIVFFARSNGEFAVCKFFSGDDTINKIASSVWIILHELKDMNAFYIHRNNLYVKKPEEVL